MSDSRKSSIETSTSKDVLRKRKKDSAANPQVSTPAATADVEAGLYPEYNKISSSKHKRDFGFCVNTLKADEEQRISGAFALLSVFILLGVGMLTVKYCDGRLPEALLIRDIPQHPHSFIEERARNDLHWLTSVGVRVSGSSETDIITVSRILGILTDIKENLSNADHLLEYEVQRPTGAFYMDSEDGQISAYDKIANVVARLSPTDANRRTNHSILVNCHFDTKPGSPGATDNMISCVTMLEVIRVLSTESPSSLKNAIVFLFNGAEELGLHGAHGFVKGYNSDLGNPDNAPVGHRWAQNLKTFINLEGAGGGGREILFQTGPGNGWTLEAYAKGAARPYGVAIAEEAFQQDLIPSDTDFRIFRDFGDIPGLDMAFIKNGWVYHTHWDRVSEIPSGSIQHMGANALGILKEMSGNLNFDEVESSDGKMVFFDVLGLFMIYYPRWAGILIDCLVAVLTLTAIVVSVILDAKYKGKVILGIVWLPISAILSWAAGIGIAGLVAVFMNACGYPKPFYSYPSLAMVIFGVPAAIGQILVHAYAQQQSPIQTWMAQKLALAIILFIATWFTRAVYVITINLLFSVIAWTAMKYLCRGWSRAITLAYLITGEFIPFLITFNLLVTLSDVFVPIMGRSGSETNANLFFGLIVAAIVVILIWNGFVFIFVQFRRRVLWTCLLAMFFVGNTLLVFGFIGKVPYQEKTPMRINMAHVDRTWYPDESTNPNTEVGYWLWPYDSNTKNFFDTFEKVAPEFGQVVDVELDYENCRDLYCAQPFMWPTVGSIKTTHWLPQNKSLPDDVKSQVQLIHTTRQNDGNRVTIDFELEGPSQMAIVLSPGANHNLVSWTLSESIPESGGKWKGRDTYFIFLDRGVDSKFIRFSCVFQNTGPSSGDNARVADLLVTGFFAHGPHLMTAEFRNLVSRLPAWTYTMPWTAVMKIYRIPRIN